MSQDIADPIINNSFATLLNLQRKGKLLSELSAAMQSAVVAARDHGADASVTLVLKITPASNDGAMAVSDEVKLKLPVPKKPRTLLYATEDGRLQKEDPQQTEMELKTLPDQDAPAEPLKVLSQ